MYVCDGFGTEFQTYLLLNMKGFVRNIHGKESDIKIY